MANLNTLIQSLSSAKELAYELALKEGSVKTRQKIYKTADLILKAIKSTDALEAKSVPFDASNVDWTDI